MSIIKSLFRKERDFDRSQRQFGTKHAEDQPDTTVALNQIEGLVYEYLKPLGFRKFGRTLHRFVSEDISQVVNFQSGYPADGMGGSFCVNLGIRVPECVEKELQPSKPRKKYYKEYDCNIRSRLGDYTKQGDVWYDLRNKPEKIAEDIVTKLQEHVIPVFDDLNSREAILQNRRKHKDSDNLFSHLILLDEAFIYGHLGKMEEAKCCFEEYYQHCLTEYEDTKIHGRKTWLEKGNVLVYLDQNGRTQTIKAQKSGYVTIFDASKRHLDYLDELAIKVGFR